MAYLVNITFRAERDLVNRFQEINAEGSAALKWYEGPNRAVLSLEHMPGRGPVTRKRDKLRHLLYGRKSHVYRVICRLREKQKQVDILHIRHGARRKIESSDLA